MMKKYKIEFTVNQSFEDFCKNEFKKLQKGVYIPFTKETFKTFIELNRGRLIQDFFNDYFTEILEINEIRKKEGRKE